MTDKKAQAAIEAAIPDGSENTVADIMAHFKKCGIDPSLRADVMSKVNPLVQAVHDICVEARVPFIIALDVSTPDSIADDKSLVMSSVNAPGGPTAMLMAKAFDLFRPVDELSRAIENITGETVRLQEQANDRTEHPSPELAISVWQEKVAEGDMVLGYWDWCALLIRDQIERELAEDAVKAVQAALGGEMRFPS